VVTVLCAGCSRPLSERQGARAAWLATTHPPAGNAPAALGLPRPTGRAELLVVAERAEQAPWRCAGAVAAGQDHDATVAELLATAAALAALSDSVNGEPPRGQQPGVVIFEGELVDLVRFGRCTKPPASNSNR